MNSFYSDEELATLGFKAYGKNILISKKCSIYTPEKISIGNNVRIDDFCILSGEISLGNYIHIAAYSALYGQYGIEMQDFTGLSPRCTIFSASDDFSGDFLISPMPKKIHVHVTGGRVILKKFTQIGSNSVIMPHVTLAEGTAIGACSLVLKSTDPWSIYVGIPIRKIKNRKKGLLNFEKYYTL